MKIGFYDTDPAGGMIPMIIELEENNIPFKQIGIDNLTSVKGLDLLIINYLSLPHLHKEYLERSCSNIKKLVESNPNTRFLIMVPGEEWIGRMNRDVGTQENVDYIPGADTSKLTELLGQT